MELEPFDEARVFIYTRKYPTEYEAFERLEDDRKMVGAFASYLYYGAKFRSISFKLSIDDLYVEFLHKMIANEKEMSPNGFELKNYEEILRRFIEDRPWGYFRQIGGILARK